MIVGLERKPPPLSPRSSTKNLMCGQGEVLPLRRNGAHHAGGPDTCPDPGIRYQRHHLFIFSGTALLSALGALAKGEGDPRTVAGGAFTALIGVLALHRARTVFAKPKKGADPVEVSPPRYLFAA
jgi:hypothetical protein